jgi:hypothetical protein
MTVAAISDMPSLSKSAVTTSFAGVPLGRHDATCGSTLVICQPLWGHFSSRAAIAACGKVLPSIVGGSTFGGFGLPHPAASTNTASPTGHHARRNIVPLLSATLYIP